LNAQGVQRVSLRRLSRVLGFADVRLPGVNLSGIRIEEQPSGRLMIRPPELAGGRPAFALQPGAREAIETEIPALWRLGRA
jgi:hypothetical protein